MARIDASKGLKTLCKTLLFCFLLNATDYSVSFFKYFYEGVKVCLCGYPLEEGQIIDIGLRKFVRSTTDL